MTRPATEHGRHVTYFRPGEITLLFSPTPDSSMPEPEWIEREFQSTLLRAWENAELGIALHDDPFAGPSGQRKAILLENEDKNEDARSQILQTVNLNTWIRPRDLERLTAQHEAGSRADCEQFDRALTSVSAAIRALEAKGLQVGNLRLSAAAPNWLAWLH